MKVEDFQMILDQFRNADLDGKIDIYVNSEDLSQEQYRELLRFFPISEIPRLENVLNNM